MLENIRIVLVETSHNGNIGSVARAMKTMGITELFLVNPKANIDSHAVALAAGASDIIGNAKIVGSLDEAISGCGLVIGTSARSRSLDWPILTARQAGEKAVVEGQQSKVVIIFGRERSGLTNSELQKCHYHLAVDANPEYTSLNLAMAVQLVCYEIRTAWQLAGLDPLSSKSIASSSATQMDQISPDSSSISASQSASGSTCETSESTDDTSIIQPKSNKFDPEAFPLVDDMERFYVHLEQVLYKSHFIRKAHPGQIMARLRRVYTRARPNNQELNILRGILASVEKFIPQENDKPSQDK